MPAKCGCVDVGVDKRRGVEGAGRAAKKAVRAMGGAGSS